MKKIRIIVILFLGVAMLSSGFQYAVNAAPNKQSAEAASHNESEYEWQSVECIGVSPPYKYGDYDNVSFELYFDKQITSVNYKHLAASAQVLKTMSRWDNPNTTPEIIDNLENTGVLASMNDCIAFNGKTVRELQKSSQLAVMVLLGELGANNKMNIDFNGAVDDVKIDNLDAAFEITLYKGLRFPSGVELKETVSWKYDYKTRKFKKINLESDSSDASFSAYYNGNKLTKGNNLVTVYQKDYKEALLSIFPESQSATYTVEPQFEKMHEGYNYLIVTCVAGDKVTRNSLQIVLNLVSQKKTDDSIPTIRLIKLIAFAVLLVLCVALVIRIFYRKREQG